MRADRISCHTYILTTICVDDGPFTTLGLRNYFHLPMKDLLWQLFIKLKYPTNKALVVEISLKIGTKNKKKNGLLRRF